MHVHVCLSVTAGLCFTFVFVVRYNGEGRVTNITLPTGEVSGLHGNLERWSRVEVEASNRENYVTSTNLSASDTIYTFKQGEALLFVFNKVWAHRHEFTTGQIWGHDAFTPMHVSDSDGIRSFATNAQEVTHVWGLH